MLENSVTIVLAILSLVCVYLIWENFKQSSKIRYLESSIHETIQTVQGLVNNSLCLPAPRNNYHPEPVKPPQPQPQPQPRTEQKQEQQEQLEEEPFEMSDELKEKINNLTFNDEEEDEHIEELSFDGDGDMNVVDVECEDLPDELTEMVEEVKPEVVEVVEKVEEVKPEVVEVEEVKPEVVEVEKVKPEVVEAEEVKPEVEEETSDDYIKNPNLLNEMSLKTLREIAEKRNLGHRGSKEQLITKIRRDISN
jgi:septum formation topological specificity factor MinE